MKDRKNTIHIGRCIKQRLEDTGLTTVELAQQLGCHRTNLYKIYDRPTIDTGILLRISKIMGYNFFELYDKELEV